MVEQALKWWPTSARRRVPFVAQMESVECGAASLCMILGYHGHFAPLAEVRQRCGVSREGASAAAIVRAAESYGLDATGWSAELGDLSHLALPAIIYNAFNHFVVLERVSRTGAVLVDPGVGRTIVSMKEMDRRFTGIVLTVVPNARFRRRRRERRTLRRYLSGVRVPGQALVLVVATSIVLQGLGLAPVIATEVILDFALPKGESPWLLALGVGLILAILLRAALDCVRRWTIQTIHFMLDVGLLTRYVATLLRLPMSFFLQRRPGDLLQRLDDNIVVRDLLASRSVAAALDGLLLLGYGAAMIAYNAWLGSVVLVLTSVQLLLAFWIRERLQTLVSVELSAAGWLRAGLVDALSALETIFASGTDHLINARLADRVVDQANSRLERRRLELRSSHAWALLQAGVVGGTVLVGGGALSSRALTPGTLAALLVLQRLFEGCVGSVLAGAMQLFQLGGHLSRLDDVLLARPERTGPRKDVRLSGAIVLDRVSFKYSPEGPWVLQDVSLKIAAGEVVAVIGATGSGKSTLAQILVGLQIPTSGRVLFDDVELGEIDLETFRGQVGVVTQENALFAGSIEGNLSLWDSAVGRDRLQEVARVACADAFVEARRGAYEAPVGDGGGQFSGGERQRLCIARALVHEPAILLLDEATSALDPHTAEEVSKKLAKVGCTQIVIAHRLETVMQADRIVCLDHGCIVQVGTFDSLSRTPGLFQSITRDSPAERAARADE